MFEKGCWISDAYQLHGLCRGEVKNRIKTYDSGRNLKMGEDPEGGGGGRVQEHARGGGGKKKIDMPNPQSPPTTLSIMAAAPL